ncbi:MAG: hypothetical protein SOH81_10620 [Acetobacter sp.]
MIEPDNVPRPHPDYHHGINGARQLTAALPAIVIVATGLPQVRAT